MNEHVRLEPVPGESTELEWPELTGWVRALKDARSLVREVGEERDTPLVLEGNRLYLDRHHRLQSRLAAALLDRAKRPRDDVDFARLKSALSRHFPPWTLPGVDRARLAACVAAFRSMTVLTGGPGTGKTTAVVRLLATLLELWEAPEEHPPQVLLLAPTAKASARLKQAVREGMDSLSLEPAIRAAIPEVASTLHRALGLGGPAHRRKREPRQLSADIVVVDEASMVDLALMTRLIESLRSDARLILLGDRDQLASVEAGSVLGDLCNAGELIPGLSEGLWKDCRAVAGEAGDWSDLPEPSPETGMHDGIVALTHVWRFEVDSGIGALSRAIHAGDPEAVMSVLSDPLHSGELNWVSSGVASDRVALLQQRIVGGMETRLAALETNDWSAVLAELESSRILCAHRRGPGGAEEINEQASRWLVDRGLQSRDLNPPGTPLLVTANDVESGLFNGDAGVVVRDRNQPDRRVVIFPGGEEGGIQQFPAGHLPQHALLHAMTVHKSQGSQFDAVVIVLPSRPSPILTRELLYTAVTRARKSVTLVGSPEIVTHAVSHRIDRASGLRDLLWKQS